jgi:hypothetical protein
MVEPQIHLESADFAAREPLFAVVSITSLKVNLLTPHPNRGFTGSESAQRAAKIGVFV